MTLNDIIREILLETELKPWTKGFKFWERAIEYAVAYDSPKMRDIYKWVGAYYKENCRNVENSMQYATNRALENETEEFCSWCFASSERVNVTNKSFLVLAAREAKKRLRNFRENT